MMRSLPALLCAAAVAACSSTQVAPAASRSSVRPCAALRQPRHLSLRDYDRVTGRAVVFRSGDDAVVTRSITPRRSARFSRPSTIDPQVRDVLLGRRLCARPQHQRADHRGCSQGCLGTRSARRETQPAAATDKETRVHRGAGETLHRRIRSRNVRHSIRRTADAMRDVTARVSRTISKPPPCSRSR